MTYLQIIRALISETARQDRFEIIPWHTALTLIRSPHTNQIKIGNVEQGIDGHAPTHLKQPDVRPLQHTELLRQVLPLGRILLERAHTQQWHIGWRVL